MTEAVLNDVGGAPDIVPPSAKHVLAVAAGNGLEFYDFLTYTFFSAQIGLAFFPSANPASSLLASLATFGAGFMTRPVGAWVIGRLGDRKGRKPAMLLTFALMGVAIVGLALTPSYRQIGIAAPIVAIAFRLVQGFALGGEVGPSTAYLAEAAPPGRRGLYVSFQLMSQQVAILAAGVVGVVLSDVMDADALCDLGWRIAFLIGALILPFGFGLRRGLAETFQAPQAEARPPAAGSYVRVAALGLVALAAATIATYVLTYLPTYASATLHMPVRASFLATTVLGLSGAVFMPVGGLLSDRFGRRPMMLGASAVLALVTMPCFALIARERDAATLLAADGLMSAISSLAFGAMLAAVTEGLPRQVRSHALSLVYASAIAVFGGTAQFNVAWLTEATHNPMAPAWYMTAALAIGILAMLGLRETAPGRAAPA